MSDDAAPAPEKLRTVKDDEGSFSLATTAFGQVVRSISPTPGVDFRLDGAAGLEMVSQLGLDVGGRLLVEASGAVEWMAGPSPPPSPLLSDVGGAFSNLGNTLADAVANTGFSTTGVASVALSDGGVLATMAGGSGPRGLLEVVAHPMPSGNTVLIIDDGKVLHVAARPPGARRFLILFQRKRGEDFFLGYEDGSANGRSPPSAFRYELRSGGAVGSKILSFMALRNWATIDAWHANKQSSWGFLNEWPKQSDLEGLRRDALRVLRSQRIAALDVFDSTVDALTAPYTTLVDALVYLTSTLSAALQYLGTPTMLAEWTATLGVLAGAATAEHVLIKAVMETAMPHFLMHVLPRLEGVGYQVRRLKAMSTKKLDKLVSTRRRLREHALRRELAALWQAAFANLYAARLADVEHWPLARRERCSSDSNALYRFEPPDVPWEHADADVRERRRANGKYLQLNDGFCLSQADLLESYEAARVGSNFNLFETHPVGGRRYTDVEKVLLGLVFALTPDSMRVVAGDVQVGALLPIHADWPDAAVCTPPTQGWPNVVRLAGADGATYARDWVGLFAGASFTAGPRGKRSDEEEAARADARRVAEGERAERLRAAQKMARRWVA